MTDENSEIPDDILEDLLRYGRVEVRRGRQREKDKWIARARALFVPLRRQDCCICDRHIGITHAHHVVTLSDQFDRGFKEPDHSYVWLCPNHHAIVHLFLSGSAVSEGAKFGGLLEGFTRDQIRLLHDLLMKSRGPAGGA